MVQIPSYTTRPGKGVKVPQGSRSSLKIAIGAMLMQRSVHQGACKALIPCWPPTGAQYGPHQAGTLGPAGPGWICRPPQGQTTAGLCPRRSDLQAPMTIGPRCSIVFRSELTVGHLPACGNRMLLFCIQTMVELERWEEAPSCLKVQPVDLWMVWVDAHLPKEV